MTDKQKAEKAIIWIERLSMTRMKQGIGGLGDRNTGFCCLGFGCYINDLKYDKYALNSDEFSNMVGLKDEYGGFSEIQIEGCSNLADLNDRAKLSFNQISKVMQKHPYEMFEEGVAKHIEKHFNQ